MEERKNGRPILAAGKSTYDTYRRCASRTAPDLKFGEAGRKTKIAAASGGTVCSHGDNGLARGGDSRCVQVESGARKRHFGATSDTERADGELGNDAWLRRRDSERRECRECGEATGIPFNGTDVHLRMQMFAEKHGRKQGGRYVELPSGNERLRSGKRRARWVGRGDVGGKLEFLSEVMEADVELGGSPAALVGGDGEDPHLGEIWIKLKSLEEIPRQRALRHANEDRLEE